MCIGRRRMVHCKLELSGLGQYHDGQLPPHSHVKTKTQLLTFLLLFSTLFASLLFVAPVYVDYTDPSPDEWFDVSAIPQRHNGVVKRVHARAVASSCSDVIPYLHTLQPPQPEGCQVCSIIPELALSVTLRC